MSNNAKNLPEVKLGQYKGLAVTRHVRPLSEKTIDQEMVHQTRMRSVYHNSTAPAKRGSRVLLDFVGFMDGEEIPDSRMEKVMVVLGGMGSVPGSVISAIVLTVLPEALREVADYRMLVYAIVLILVMQATNNPTMKRFFASAKEKLTPGRKERAAL